MIGKPRFKEELALSAKLIEAACGFGAHPKKDGGGGGGVGGGGGGGVADGIGVGVVVGTGAGVAVVKAAIKGAPLKVPHPVARS